MDEQLVLAVDLGTSGCKTALVSHSGKVLAWAYRPVALHLLDGAGAEQVPEDWWQALLTTARDVRRYAARRRAKAPSPSTATACR
jgi:xylulokinase